MSSPEPTPLRRLRREDFPALAPLLREAWPAEDWEARFRRQWLENPALSDDLAMGWVLEEGGELQAFFGSIPLPYQVASRPAIAFASTALYVRPALRGRGVGSALIDAWRTQPGGELWVTTTSNAPSARLLDRCATPTLARADAIAHLAARPWAAARRALAERTGAGALLHVALLPVAAARALQLHLRTRALRAAAPQGCHCRRESQPPPDLDELWRRLAPAYPTTLRRDARTLRWLLFEGPGADRNHFITCRDGAGRLLAWAALRAEPRRDELRQVDAFGPRTQPELACALAAAAAASARRAGLSNVRLWAADPLQIQALQAAGLQPTPQQGTIHYHFARTELESEVYFSNLDGDRVLDVLL